MRHYILLITILIATHGAFSQELIKKDDGKYYKDDKLFTGIHKDYFDDGILKSERAFKNGLENGTSIYYYTLDKKKEQREYNDGFKSGTWLTWNLEGQKTAEAHYVKDLKHGKWIIYDDNGNKRYKMNYDHGKKVGRWYMWD